MTPFRRDPPSSLDADAFVSRYGGVYEHSPWIAETLVNTGQTRPDTAEELAAALAAIVETAPPHRQFTLLRVPTRIWPAGWRSVAS